MDQLAGLDWVKRFLILDQIYTMYKEEQEEKKG